MSRLLELEWKSLSLLIEMIIFNYDFWTHWSDSEQCVHASSSMFVWTAIVIIALDGYPFGFSDTPDQSWARNQQQSLAQISASPLFSLESLIVGEDF